MEQTFIMIKPDAFKTGCKDTILKNIYTKVAKIDGLSIRCAMPLEVNDEFIKAHYAEHKEKAFYDELLGYFEAEDIFGIVIEGHDAIILMREYVQEELRPKYAKNKFENAIHASSSAEDALSEIENFYKHLDEAAKAQ